MPVGPHILCPEKARKSHVQRLHVHREVGHGSAPRRAARARLPWAAAMICSTGLIVPSTLLMCVTLTSLTPSSMLVQVVEDEQPLGDQRRDSANSTLRSPASMCQGTRLEWCSILLSEHDIARPRLARPQV